VHHKGDAVPSWWSALAVAPLDIDRFKVINECPALDVT